MSNERLRAAIHQAGIEIDELADIVGADAKTIRRWIAGRTPRGRYRTLVADALNRTEQELWPELDLQVSGRDERGEILAAYAHASDLATPDWRTLLQTATRQVDLLDLTLADVLASAGTIDLLRQRADGGCHLRLLVSAPDSAHHALHDAEQGHDLTLTDIPPSARAAQHSIALIEPLLASERIEAREYITAHATTILRIDDEMLVTVQLYGTPADQSPLLHLQRHSDHGLFEQLAAHYDAIWQDAHPLQPTTATAG